MNNFILNFHFRFNIPVGEAGGNNSFDDETVNSPVRNVSTESNNANNNNNTNALNAQKGKKGIFKKVRFKVFLHF